MNIQNIAVDTQILHSDTENVQWILDEAKAEVANMHDTIMELSRMWEGSAHDAFLTQFRSDCEKMQELFNTIDKLIESMRYANKEYNVCEAAVRAVIDSIGH